MTACEGDNGDRQGKKSHGASLLKVVREVGDPLSCGDSDEGPPSRRLRIAEIKSLAGNVCSEQTLHGSGGGSQSNVGRTA